jgi:hypothetical protein
MRERAVQLAFADFLPGAFGVLLSAAHACGEIFQTIHVQPSTPVARWKDTLALSQTLHPMDHLGLEGATVVLLCGLARTLARSREQAGWRVWDGYW